MFFFSLFSRLSRVLFLLYYPLISPLFRVFFARGFILGELRTARYVWQRGATGVREGDPRPSLSSGRRRLSRAPRAQGAPSRPGRGRLALEAIGGVKERRAGVGLIIVRQRFHKNPEKVTGRRIVWRRMGGGPIDRAEVPPLLGPPSRVLRLRILPPYH